MHKINLFPPWVQQRKNRRRIIRSFILVQVAVFLLTGGVYYLMTAIESQARERTLLLSQQLADMDREPAQAAEAVREAENMQRLTADFIESRYTLAFDPHWLPVVINTAPEGVQLLSFDFSGVNIILAAIAPSLGDIGIHQRQMEETGLFGSVLFGQAVRLENGSVRYELRLGTGP
jgi:Tfp pilus assembly protein PilN